MAWGTEVNILNYEKLKENDKITISKEIDEDKVVYKATIKQYDVDTGDSLDDKIVDIKLDNLTFKKTRLEKQQSETESEINALDVLISDLEKL